MMSLSMVPQLAQRHELRCSVCSGLAIAAEVGPRVEATLHLLEGGSVEGWCETGRCPASWCLGYARRPAGAVLERWLRNLARQAARTIREPGRQVDGRVLALLDLAGRPGNDRNLAIRMLRAARGPRQTLAAAVWLVAGDGRATADALASAVRQAAS